MGTLLVALLAASTGAAIAITATVRVRRRRTVDAGRRAIRQLGRAAERQGRRRPSTDDAPLDEINRDARSAVDQLGGGF
ncbi:hypothetical protein GCM10010169_22400 [Micromonospora fulviviridis]|uniref:hypothetical protein n=1 Tax=Micromonospora fulviviridis TaxID=47860 RepID=UPI00166442E4|nr:hypothetical protein [Micromonospora fulviviridis]GGR77644.1 hypothetical protein GCM10010169_22400 [Micromonospora fulviviridis]